jgi:molybdate transport system substrate-binding protein
MLLETYRRTWVRRIGLALAVSLVGGTAAAAEINVAVAANFTMPAEALAAAFKAETGHRVLLSLGATGSLYAQITQGAPFAAFLGADDARPAQAVAEGHGVEGTAFTYAVGALALYSPMIDVNGGEATLRDGNFAHVAIADPATAPYGAAAVEVIAGLGLMHEMTPKLVIGQNVAQALQFVESGNAELGFVALSQVMEKPAARVWRVPAELHRPIRQDAVLLKAGEHDPVAKSFLHFLRGDAARAIIASHGYDVP